MQKNLQDGFSSAENRGTLAHPKMAKAPAKPEPAIQLVAKNRRARFEYDIGDTLEAGLQLIGSEVRSLRDQGADLSDAWIDIDSRGEAWVKGLRIPQLKHAAFSHEEKRSRKLLIHRSEIDRLKGALEREGMTLIATSIYFKGSHAKLAVSTAKGRKHHDKRQYLKEREDSRDARQAMLKHRGGH